jgi:tRNA(fMet)-specific endonuclease VapC
MIILDTDHCSALQVKSARRDFLKARLAASRDRDIAVSVITIEEQLRGWLAEIAARLDAARQVGAYQKLAGLVHFFAAWQIAEFDDTSAQRFAALRKARLRGGTMDLKIAAIALARGALLLTANTRDFAGIPGLRLENWLD